MSNDLNLLTKSINLRSINLYYSKLKQSIEKETKIAGGKFDYNDLNIQTNIQPSLFCRMTFTNNLITASRCNR